MRPIRIIDSNNTKSTDKLLNNIELQPSFGVSGYTVIENGGYVLLDFGRELCGGIAVTIQRVSTREGKLRIVFGESVSEALSEIGDKNSGNHHSVRDWTIDALLMSTHKIGSTAFRFVKLQAVGADVQIKAVKAESDIRDVAWKGSFSCNDELLNEIWQTGAYTIQLNMHEFLWDGAKRDRLVWVGDMHPEMKTINAVFGKDECIPESLDFVKNDTPPEAWMNKIATYSMWWIIIHYDWYMHWGDMDYLQKQNEYIKKITDHAEKWINDGCKGEGMTCFVEWGSKDEPCETDGVKAVFCMGLFCAAKLFGYLQEDEYMKKCERLVECLRAQKIMMPLNKRIAAITYLSGRKSDDIKLLEGDSAKEISCFMGYYVLKAKAELGQMEEALEIIRQYWGGMLKMGATTFWEDFDIDWMQNSAPIDRIPKAGERDIHGDFGRYCYEGFRHSLCHGWATGPTSFLSEYISGIKIVQPGCRKVSINPNLAGLKWAKISYPTPYGNIEINLEQGNVVINAPEEVEIV